MSSPWYFYIGGVIVALLFIVPAIKIVWQYQVGVVFRFGKLLGERKPGINFILPYIDRMIKIDMRVETLVVDPQEVITRDNVTVQVDAVVYYRPINAVDVIVKVADFDKATVQIALTTLRSVLGQMELDDLLTQRDKINQRLREIIDEHTEPWGIQVSIVEVKDVLLPENLQRSIARQAEAERERRAKIIHADGELQASEALAQAGDRLAKSPASLELRYLQALVEMSNEGNSTILPIPMNIINRLGKAE
ncbi:MAG: slipin family protein [Gammaproteobacteria bacterium]|nr:slipin family protein [Gammaproteobacteria bacterium]